MVKIIAHRGASGEFPENTLSAVLAALDHQVDFIEVDVRLSKDGVPIILHDDSTERMMVDGACTKIHELHFDEIRKIDVGAWFSHSFKGEKIPALKELLALNWKNTGLMIELKECPQPDNILVQAVFDVLDSLSHSIPKIVIGSFSPNIVNEVKLALKHRKRFHDNIELIGSVEELEFIDKFIDAGVGRLALWEKLVNPLLLSSLKKNKVQVWGFTVDDLSIAHSLVSIEIDGLITNHPRRLNRSATQTLLDHGN